MAFPIAIGPREGAALRDWVQREGALRTLETGLAHAVSTRFICQGLLANGPTGHHVAIDPYQQSAYKGAGLQALEEAGVRELVEFYEEESQIVLPRLVAEGRRFDLAFIDGNHRFEGVFLDLVYSGRLLKERGIVFTDDTQLAGVRKAVAFCETNLGWTVEDSGTEGEREWLVLRTGSHDAFVRPFDQFAEF